MNDFAAALLLHVLGDFYFQTDRSSREKEQSYKKLLGHAGIYAAGFFLFFFFKYPGLYGFLAGLFFSAVHLGIDTLKFFAAPRIKDKRIVYAGDQLLHITSLVGVLALLPAFNHGTAFLQIPTPWLCWILLLLLVGKPANITFAALLGRFRAKSEEADGVLRAGALIGALERILTVIFLSLSQYAAIGLVLTAKSIARYDGIAKNPAFAEYYLIGTLYSVLYSLCAYFAVMALMPV